MILPLCIPLMLLAQGCVGSSVQGPGAGNPGRKEEGGVTGAAAQNRLRMGRRVESGEGPQLGPEQVGVGVGTQNGETEWAAGEAEAGAGVGGEIGELEGAGGEGAGAGGRGMGLGDSSKERGETKEERGEREAGARVGGGEEVGEVEGAGRGTVGAGGTAAAGGTVGAVGAGGTVGAGMGVSGTRMGDWETGSRGRRAEGERGIVREGAGDGVGEAGVEGGKGAGVKVEGTGAEEQREEGIGAEGEMREGAGGARVEGGMARGGGAAEGGRVGRAGAEEGRVGRAGAEGGMRAGRMGIEDWAAGAGRTGGGRGGGRRLQVLALTMPVGQASQSHFHIMTRLGEELVERGHHVTLPIHVHMESRSATIQMVRYGSNLTSAEWESNTQSYMTELVYGNISVAQLARMVDTMTAECDVMLTDKTLRAVLMSQVFDVAIVDHIFTCGFLLARQLSLPVVVLECALHQSGLTDSVDPHPLAYVPVDLTGFTHRMSFSERAQNAIRYWLHVIMFPQLMLRPFDAIKEKHKMAPGVDISMMKREALLWVTNQCWALNYPRPLLPAVIAAGGLLTRPAKPLSQDFTSLFAAAGDAGVIIVTFGSYLTLRGIPALESAVLQGLAHLPQTVIYRANHSVPDAPPNVVVRNHLPQNDLFGHPGTRAVVLHGGLNGVYESVYHALPILVIPFGFDAIDNAVRVRDKGMARIINPYDVTPERVRAAMLDLLSNNSYSQRAQKVSALFTDRTQHPLETAAFWVEHVMRQKTEITSRDYLRSAGNELRLWELYLTDVTAAFLFLLLVLLVVIYRLTKCAWKSFIGSVKYKVE